MQTHDTKIDDWSEGQTSISQTWEQHNDIVDCNDDNKMIHDTIHGTQKQVNVDLKYLFEAK